MRQILLGLNSRLEQFMFLQCRRDGPRLVRRPPGFLEAGGAPISSAS